MKLLLPSSVLGEVRNMFWPDHEGIIHHQTANINIESVVNVLPWLSLFGLNLKHAHMTRARQNMHSDATDKKILASLLECAVRKHIPCWPLFFLVQQVSSYTFSGLLISINTA